MNNNNENIIPIELLSRVFANEANAEERLQLEQWRDTSAKNLKEYNAFKELWELSDKANTIPDIDVDAEWRKLDKNISAPFGKIILLQRVLQMAAMVIVLVGLGYLIMNQTNKQSTKTQIAQVQTINLPDGSTITLNADSKLSYNKDFGKTQRNIKLKGEAFFNVAKNNDIPFIIDAQGATIKVVGTQFNVKAYKLANNVKVTVIEGTVQFFESKQPAKKTVLTAGETGIYMKRERALTKMEKIDANDIAWKTYKMQFDNTPLWQVAAVIENTYHIQIELTEKVRNCNVTVEFDQKDLASVLKVLKSTLDLTITRQKDTLIISGDGC